MPLDTATPRTAGISNDETLDWARKIRRAGRDKDESHGRYRAVLKDAKSHGVETKEMISALGKTKLDPDEVAASLATEVHYLSLLGLNTVTAERIFARDARITEKTQTEEDRYDAEEAGHKAGRRGEKIDSNPYEPGTELYVVWREWWGKGQASIAAEMGPGDRMSSAAKAHPGRAGESGTKVQTSTPGTPAPAKKAAAKKAASKAATTAKRKAAAAADGPGDNIPNLH